MTSLHYDGAVLWDLDGTLVTTAKAGRVALRESVFEATGVAPDFTNLPTSGFTDAEVAAAALRRAGVEPDEDLLLRVRVGYERRLPEALKLRAGGVLPGVVETLDGLAERGRVVSLLLTGNTPAGARAKLERYGIADRFPHGGGFCEGPGGRAPIAERALLAARRLVRDFDLDRVLLVGDTPRDVACAVELGIRALALATGAHPVDELRAAGAWLALERVPGPQELEALALGVVDPRVVVA